MLPGRPFQTKLSSKSWLSFQRDIVIILFDCAFKGLVKIELFSLTECQVCIFKNLVVFDTMTEESNQNKFVLTKCHNLQCNQ